ncbi:hypothetical protein HYC85_015104 [Camellia sinensis]|uniref:Uncharacterized protein n=1 Tax=Camellia sinensis TaxID=4442 RepID=A0A7J7H9E0_CAMSI|nr:hypothetical protein HYC85_015104 [Camellia sinensis]
MTIGNSALILGLWSVHFFVDKLLHCKDGTSDTVKQSFTFVRDFMDICYHSYFSVTDDLRSQGHQDGKYFEIRSLPPFLLLLRLRRSSLHRPPPVPKLMDLPHVNRQIGVISV